MFRTVAVLVAAVYVASAAATTSSELKALAWNQEGTALTFDSGDKCYIHALEAAEIVGHTLDGRPVIKGKSCDLKGAGFICFDYFLFYDKDCDGTGRFPNRWFAMEEEPDRNKASQLTSKCGDTINDDYTGFYKKRISTIFLPPRLNTSICVTTR